MVFIKKHKIVIVLRFLNTKLAHLDTVCEKGQFNSPNPPGKDIGYLKCFDY